MNDDIKQFIGNLAKALGVELYPLPIESFKNTVSSGHGIRIIIGGTKKAFRLNFDSSNPSLSNISSVDLWDGTSHDPFAHIVIDGNITDENTFGNSLAKLIKKPSIGTVEKVGSEVKEESLNLSEAETPLELEVVKGGKGETYAATSAEKNLPGLEHIDFQKQLNHLRSLVVGIVKGASNALFVYGRGGTGKSLYDQTLILTSNGWKRISEINIGDYVISLNGEPTKVIGVYPQGNLPLLEFEFFDGRKIKCSEDHLWEVIIEGNSKVLTSIEILNLIDSGNLDRRICVPLFNPNYSEIDVELPCDPYIMGALLGDGHFCGDGSIKISTKDDEILEQFKILLGSDYFLKHINRCDYRISMTERKFGSRTTSYHKYVKLIKDLNLFKTRSNSKFIPEIFLNGSNIQKLNLLQGLMDTDGTVGKSGNISFTTVSEQLKNDVCELIYSLGGKAKVTSRIPKYRYKGELKTGQLAYTIAIQFQDPKRLFRLQRKIDLTSSNNQYSNVGLPIISIKRLEDTAECVCIKVEDERGLFVVENYVVTHNTTVVEKTLSDMGLSDGDGYFQISGGGVSPFVAYTTLYNNRNDIVLFDDSDSMLRSEEGRNLIKTATDTKKRRKLSWSRRNSVIFDPDKVTPPEEQIGVSQFPRYFDFEGRIIFISNLTLEELDPDGSIRTRAWLIKIDPSDDEMLSHMLEILDKIKLNDGLELDQETRMRVFNIVKNSPNKEDVNVRKLVRSMNFAATGIPGWEELVHLYA